MYEVLDESSENCFGVRVSAKLTGDDYRTLIPKLESLIETYGQIRLLWLMEDFHGWEFDAFWTDARFDLRHNKDVERIAMVGEERWEQWMTKAMRPFTRGEVRYFDVDHLAAAWVWVREP